MLAFAEGDKVDYRSPNPRALPGGPAVVVDVLVEGDRTEPGYVIDLAGVGRVFAERFELTPRVELVGATQFAAPEGKVRLPGDLL